MSTSASINYKELAQQVKEWAAELGFQQLAITSNSSQPHGQHLDQWLDKQFHGEMEYLSRHRDLRHQPTELHPGTQRILCVRMNCQPPATEAVTILNNAEKGYVARYALGRDYHKMMRKRLKKLSEKIEEIAGPISCRAFVDSAPVLERGLAANAGLGWIGKNTMLLNREAGSWFLLGELFIDIPLPIDQPLGKDHCGHCTACLDCCPTQAFVAPYKLDARRCISYLTIEQKGPIPEPLRPLIGNRIFGCDDCQLVCPWNRFAHITEETDFHPRHNLDQSDLLELFAWDEATFLARTAGSPIRRTGHAGWLRNIAVALGNGPASKAVIQALHQRLEHPNELVTEHVRWALTQLEKTKLNR